MMHTTTLLNYYKVSRVLITSHGSAKVATWISQRNIKDRWNIISQEDKILLSCRQLN
jgi:hypothetical protein